MGFRSCKFQSDLIEHRFGKSETKPRKNKYFSDLVFNNNKCQKLIRNRELSSRRNQAEILIYDLLPLVRLKLRLEGN